MVAATGQGTKSLRSSPLRGGENREAGEDSDSGWQGQQINKRSVGAQHMIKTTRSSGPAP